MHFEQATAALAAAEPDSTMLDLAGDLTGVHALVIGAGALAVMCALIRRGAAGAEEIALSDRARCEPIELAIAARVSSPVEASEAVARAARALLPAGRLLLRDPTRGGAGDVLALLRDAGLVAERCVATEAGLVFVASRPMYGPIGRPAARA